jgi:hypothetical protein
MACRSRERHEEFSSMLHVELVSSTESNCCCLQRCFEKPAAVAHAVFGKCVLCSLVGSFSTIVIVHSLEFAIQP